PFREATPFAFAGQPHESMRLQRAQMVVDLLPGQADPGAESRRGGGCGQVGQEATPDRLQSHRRRRRIVDHLNVDHEGDGIIDNFCCQSRIKAFLPISRSRRPTSMAVLSCPLEERTFDHDRFLPAFALDVFSVTAARMSAINAFTSIWSFSWKSIARRV